MYIGSWPFDRARLTPDLCACTDVCGGIEYTWAKFSLECDAAANFLFRVKKINPGDRVAVIAENSIASLSLLFACATIGAVFVPIDPLWPFTVIDEILQQVRPKIIFCDESFRSFDESDNIFFFSSSLPVSCFFKASRSPGHITEVDLSPEDPLALIYLPSFEPLGIIVSHSMAYYNSVNTMLAYGFTTGSRILAAINFSSPAGLFMDTLPALFAGLPVGLVCREALSSGVIEKYSPADVFLEHPQYVRFKERFPDFSGNIAKVFSWGGIPGFDGDMRNCDRTLFPAAGMNCFVKSGNSGGNLLGLPVYNVQPKIGSSADGSELPAGYRGELFFRGPSLFSGFWNNPAATSAMFLRGWLRTRLAVKCVKGFYYFTD